MKYIKPVVKVKKIKLNQFFSGKSTRNSLSGFPDLFQANPVFAVYPPDTGTAGLKDKIYSSNLPISLERA